MGVDKATITQRIKAGKMIGFTRFTQNYVIPAEQVMSSKVVAGVAEVLALFEGHHERA